MGRCSFPKAGLIRAVCFRRPSQLKFRLFQKRARRSPDAAAQDRGRPQVTAGGPTTRARRGSPGLEAQPGGRLPAGRPDASQGPRGAGVGSCPCPQLGTRVNVLREGVSVRCADCSVAVICPTGASERRERRPGLPEMCRGGVSKCSCRLTQARALKCQVHETKSIKVAVTFPRSEEGR